MIQHKWKKWLWRLTAVLVAATAVYYFAVVWLEFKLMYPPEQIFCLATSLDDEKTATFSVRYEGERAWLPLNPQPHHYITVTDAQSGRTLLRETDFADAATGDAFARLQSQYAPWTQQTTMDCRLPGSWNDFN